MFPPGFAADHCPTAWWTSFELTTSFSFSLFLQLSSSEVDLSIDLTLGNFNDAAPLFGTDTKHSPFIGITNFPTTPVATRQMPPLAYTQPKQSSSAFNSNGLTSSSMQSSVISNNNINNNINNISSRAYNNNNNNNINNNSNTAINNVNSYQQKSSSSSSTLLLAPPPQSRATSNSGSIASANNNNTFVRPPDSKPLINGRSGYTTTSQLSKHEVNITFK